MIFPRKETRGKISEEKRRSIPIKKAEFKEV
jgi:hypothetical protein